jgi:hypothetical protein
MEPAASTTCKAATVRRSDSARINDFSRTRQTDWVWPGVAWPCIGCCSVAAPLTSYSDSVQRRAHV